MAKRINRAVELLEQGQAIYYVGGHTGHVLTYAQGKLDARTWADYINVGMEHGAFDMAGLDQYMRGLADGGPTASGHRTPPVIVEAPVDGTDEANVRFNAWQFRLVLGRGVHGVLLCQAESQDAVRAFVECCRFPNQTAGVDPRLPGAVERMGMGEASGPSRALRQAQGAQGRQPLSSSPPSRALRQAQGAQERPLSLDPSLYLREESLSPSGKGEGNADGGPSRALRQAQDDASRPADGALRQAQGAQERPLSLTAAMRADGRPWLGTGTRGRGSEPTAAPVWGLSTEEYMSRCDPWPLNRQGELLLGVKIESPEGVANCEEILAVPGIGFAEMGPGDLGLSLGYVKVPRDPYPAEMTAARERIFAACRRYGVAFLEGATPESVAGLLDEGVRVIAGGREDTARAGRAHSKRVMPV